MAEKHDKVQVHLNLLYYISVMTQVYLYEPVSQNMHRPVK